MSFRIKCLCEVALKSLPKKVRKSQHPVTGSNLNTVQPVHVAAYIEQLTQTHSKPTAKQHLAAIRMFFDWLVTGQVIPTNPAHAVRAPRYSVKKGKTPVLSAEEMGVLLNSIKTDTLIGLRDRALIALMGYTFARVGAAVSMNVEDYYIQKRRGWVRLHEKGGKVTELPCHHNLEQFLDEWLNASSLASEPSALRHGKLTGRTPLLQANVHMIIQRRALSAGIQTKVSAHRFRAIGITTYLQNGGKLEIAQQMAGNESARTTGLYDRRNDSVVLDGSGKKCVLTAMQRPLWPWSWRRDGARMSFIAPTTKQEHNVLSLPCSSIRASSRSVTPCVEPGLRQ